MTYPKKADCPNCGTAGTDLSVCRYDNGWRHVECDSCYYMAPGEASILAAIREHNARAAQTSTPSPNTALEPRR